MDRGALVNPLGWKLGIAGIALLGLGAGPPAFEHTETRAPCRHYEPLRQPFFGDTHVHTALSFDAMGQGTRGGPREAYRFARGEAIGVQPYNDAGQPQRRVRLRRPLDFTVVTDHSDLLGETRICQSPELSGYDSLICRVVRRWPKLGYMLVNGHVYGSISPKRYSFCGTDGKLCLEAARGPWQEIQDAAEEFYDRSPACRFTTFVGYEWTGMPGGDNIHRNVIFRNEVVQAAPTSYIETPTAEGLWTDLESECLQQSNGCDVIAIPHNSNVSNGRLFTLTRDDGHGIDAADARRRSRIERLVEVFQHKGASECRAGAADELCSFETLPWVKMEDSARPWRWQTPPPRVYAREVLTEGIVQQSKLGANPFKFGLIGSTDTHLATDGRVDEDEFIGHGAGLVTARLEIPEFPDAPRFNPGGLAVLWAEENLRDSLFAAMRRREAYGTSGPRIVLRFFGGWSWPDDLCQRADLATVGYARGVPMGADLPQRSGEESPRFVVSALQDAAGNGVPRTPLQRIQIVKSWVADGVGHEKVFEVAGDPQNNAGVDLASCTPRGPGFASLCSVWTDPEFEASEPALYYARVLENPSCRWNRYVCNRRGVDCSDRSTVPDALAACCNPEIPNTIQERAWSSPIWYTPAP